MVLNAVLRALNAARRGGRSGNPEWTDRLAQAAFRASEHLIVYGSLAPGGPNHGRLAALGGTWARGWVEGRLEEAGWGPRSAFRHSDGSLAAPGSGPLLRSAALPEHWAALDRFGGAGYQRILIPFYPERGSRRVGYLYATAGPGQGNP